MWLHFKFRNNSAFFLDKKGEEQVSQESILGILFSKFSSLNISASPVISIIT